jgi:inward rectifier potassium channel
MARKTKDPGLGYNSKENAQSVIKDDGSSNVNHINKKRNVNDLYSFFVDISWFRFFLLIILT